jgi:hypothetical protein
LAAKKPFGGDGVGTLRAGLCVFPALEKIEPPGLGFVCHDEGVVSMKKLALSMVAVLALLSIAGCAQYYGKGKAPPPVVTKG